MKCLNCGCEFEAARVGHKYCSAKCRNQYHNRERKVENPEKELARKNAIMQRYYREHREEICLKQKIYRVTGIWRRGRLTV